jgi:hypothetical protein
VRPEQDISRMAVPVSTHGDHQGKQGGLTVGRAVLCDLYCPPAEGGAQLPYHGTVCGTSSGYVGFTTGDGDRWQSFTAVLWHGGVDVFLGTQGGRMRGVSPGSRLLVIFLRRCIGWAWAAFDLQRQMVERYEIPGSVPGTAGLVRSLVSGGPTLPLLQLA